MKKIDEKINLRETIFLLREKKNEDFLNLKQQYYMTVDSLKPLNLVKSVVYEFINTPNLKANLLKGVIFFTINFISKKISNINLKNPINKTIFGSLQFIVDKFGNKRIILK